MIRPAGREFAARPPGVIDTLTAGYETVNRRLWLLLFPIGLDLLLWLGPKFSILGVAGFLPYRALRADEFSLVTELLARFNLMALLALHIPTVLGLGYTAAPLPPAWAGQHGLALQPIVILGPQAFLSLLLVSFFLGLLTTALYLGGIGQLLRPKGARSPFLRAGLRYWWRLIVLHVAATLVGAVLLGLWLGAGTLARGSYGAVGELLQLLIEVGLMWLGFSFFFALDAVILADDPPLQAALSSIRVIRTCFWPTIAFVGLTLLINTGLPIIWRALSVQPLGLLASVLCNAYIGTGLAAASMLFYRDRWILLKGHSLGNH